MVRRKNLKPDPKAAMADLVRRLNDRAAALETRPHGVKDLGEDGDAVWTDPDTGGQNSVRELPVLIDETAAAIEATKVELEETRGVLDGAKDDLAAERAAREQALAEAVAALAELDEKLEAGPSTADLDAIRSDLAAAREVADSATTAATEANTAAVAASQAALEAAGIAASKGRVIVSETEPTGEDRTASNIWIRPVPDDPETEVQESATTYVYLEASDEWQATTSSELAQAAQNALDAREAASQAQQRADTAVSAAATAQAAAEAAQRTANKATTDARDAHNEAVAAQGVADEALAAYGPLDQRTLDAQAAARAAQDRADEAYAEAASKATSEQVTAEITASANGKNAIRVAATAPSASTPGIVAGDVWWQVDAAGVVFAQWRWTPLPVGWVPVQVRSEVIANLDVGKLVVTGSSRFTEAVVDRLFADVFAAHKITANELTIAAVGPDGELAPESVRGVHIGDGQVTANKLVIDGDPENPDEVGLVARIASIMRLAVENLVVTDGAKIDSAVILKLASEMVTAGVIRTSETGQRVVVDRGGVVLIGLDDDGNEYELVRLGPSGENLLTIGRTTVAADGIATPSVDTGALTVSGRDVSTFPDDGARGVVAWAYSTSASAWDGSGTEIDRLRVSALLRPGRLYSVTMDQKLIRTRTGATGPRFIERLHFNAPDIRKSGQLAISVSSLPASTTTYSTPGFVGWLNMDDLGNTEDTPVQVWWSTQGVTGRDYRIDGGIGQAVRLTLRDEGPSVGSSGMSWFNTGTPAEGTADAPPPVAEKVTRTEKFAATRAESWDRGSSSFLSGKSGTVYQGKYPGVNAREGAWWFNALTGNLSGATIKRVQLRFYVTHTYWGAGGTVTVRLHGKTGFTTGGLDTSIRTMKVKRNAQYSVDVPAQYLDGFRTGTWRGFGLSTTSTDLEYYVQARLAGAEIWITYEK